MIDLNADELGEKGESRFKEICADAKLVCNKAERDRTGWDFIIEFPFENTKSISLDSRATPVSCHVQVKTLLETSKSFDMRLSSAERLAKELKPAFVYVFKVNKDKEFTESFLVHLLDDRLASVLKRLRKEEAGGTPADKINKKTISMTALDAERLEPDGASLRTALLHACGDGMHTYAAMKKEQLEKLGFGLRPYEGKVNIHLGNIEEVVDAFLGLRKDIPISNLKISQNRFGIPLPQNFPPDGKINIKPNPIDQCTITIRHDALLPPAVFDAEVFIAAIPNLPENKRKIFVKSSFFSILIKNNDESITYTESPPVY